MQQQSVRSSVAALMASRATGAEAALIVRGRPVELDECLARLPARKGPRK